MRGRLLSSFSVTVSSSLPTTTLNLRDRPTTVAPVFWCRSCAASCHSSVVNSLQPLRSLLYASAMSASSVCVVRKRTSMIFRPKTAGWIASLTTGMSSLIFRDPIGK